MFDNPTEYSLKGGGEYQRELLALSRENEALRRRAEQAVGESTDKRPDPLQQDVERLHGQKKTGDDALIRVLFGERERTAGLVRNAYTKRLSRREAALYDRLARATGVRLELVGSIADAAGNAGAANGVYDRESRTIRLAADADAPLRSVATHEITHRIQELAPEEYGRYLRYAGEYLAERTGDRGGLEALIGAKVEEYARHGVELTAERAMDEIGADFTRELVENAELFDRLARENRSVAQRVLDALRDFIRRVKGALTGQAERDAAARSAFGADLERLERAAELWQEAFDAAAETVRQGVETESAARMGGGIGAQYFIKYDRKNIPYVEVEEDILAGVPEKDWVRIVKGNLRKKFPNGVHIGRDIIKINAQTQREMTFSKYMQMLMRTDSQVYSDKLRATNNADEVLHAARNWVNEAPLHPRKDAIMDFARGEVQLRVGGQDYTAQVIVGNKGGGELLLYDIIGLKPTVIQERIRKTGANYITKS